ncbi:hypothetical protein D3C73_1068210 [compost metagenome]
MGLYLILLDDPTLCVPERYEKSVCLLYNKAINIDYAILRRRNQQVENILRQGTRFQLQNSSGTFLEFSREGDNEVLVENCQFSEVEHIFQLPGGEVYFPPQPYTAQGKIISKIGGKLQTIPVKDGMAYFELGEYQGMPVPLAEFGIGTNANLANLSFMPSYEKVWGTCHLGFGHNRNMMGVFEREYHFDIVLESFTLLIDGEMVRFHEV